MFPPYIIDFSNLFNWLSVIIYSGCLSVIYDTSMVWIFHNFLDMMENTLSYTHNPNKEIVVSWRVLACRSSISSPRFCPAPEPTIVKFLTNHNPHAENYRSNTNFNYGHCFTSRPYGHFRILLIWRGCLKNLQNPINMHITHSVFVSGQTFISLHLPLVFLPV